MVHIWYMNIPAYGHINPTLPAVRELAAGGDHITYWAHEPFRETLAPTGAAFRALPDIDWAQDDQAALSRQFTKLALALMQLTEDYLPGLVEAIEADPPDLIVHDGMCPWGWCLAHITGIKAVTSLPIFVSGSHSPVRYTLRAMGETLINLPDVFAYNTIRRRIKEAYGIDPPNILDVFGCPEPLNIVYTSREFQPNGEAYDPEEFAFVGPQIAPRPQDPDFPFDRLREDKPTVYVSLGTIMNQQPDFYRQCFDALGDMQIVLSAGRDTDIEALGPLPPDAIVRNYVPQLELLPHVDVFLTHAGMNSVHEALYHGVPLVVWPQMIEQDMVAHAVVEHQAGVRLRDPSHLREAVTQVLDDPITRENAHRLGETFRAAGGYQRTVEVLRAYCSR